MTTSLMLTTEAILLPSCPRRGGIRFGCRGGGSDVQDDKGGGMDMGGMGGGMGGMGMGM
jgi:hypothetical protein